MSDEHPADRAPGPAAVPAWAAMPTMPWTRVAPEQRTSIEDAAPVAPEFKPAPRTAPPAGSVPVSGAPASPVPVEPGADAAPDPEQRLAGFRWRFDPDTLREVFDDEETAALTEIRDQLGAKVDATGEPGPRARLLSLRALVSRLLGDLDRALGDGRVALTHAEATGELRRVAIAQARLAHILQWRGDFAEADRLFTLANSTELPERLRATMNQHAGKCAYDQGRYIEACNHFERALDLRKDEDPELIASTELALDAVFRRVAERGWGPYPRDRDEILKIRKPLAPTYDEHTQRWGFVDEMGVFRITPKYLDVQPFRDGVAWVQRPGSAAWELIDDTGRLLVDHTSGYLGVGSFADGVAWVSRDGATGWIAVDKTNQVLIPTGYDDVRPFRRGLAAVRRAGRWGAVDTTGRVVVALHYDGFATALHDGRYIDGFSDEGLAVVLLGAFRGVVDRTGRVLVPAMYHTLVIHPVAFLFTDAAQRWGALDRRGRPLLPAYFPSRTTATDEIDRLLADTRPLL